MIIEIIASMCGTLAFVILFHGPRKEYIFCVVNGALGWTAYLTFMRLGYSVAAASLGATLILTIMSRILSIIRRCPSTIFLVTGIFTLVPGAGIYYTAYYLIMDDLIRFGEMGLETFKISGAIVLGIVFGFAIPQKWFNKLGRSNRHVGR